jgi:hypothetical protein
MLEFLVAVWSAKLTVDGLAVVWGFLMAAVKAGLRELSKVFWMDDLLVDKKADLSEL